jgi:hypothetical protein
MIEQVSVSELPCCAKIEFKTRIAFRMRVVA